MYFQIVLNDQKAFNVEAESATSALAQFGVVVNGNPRQGKPYQTESGNTLVYRKINASQLPPSTLRVITPSNLLTVNPARYVPLGWNEAMQAAKEAGIKLREEKENEARRTRIMLALYSPQPTMGLDGRLYASKSEAKRANTEYRKRFQV